MVHAPLRKTTGVIELARLRHPCPPTLSSQILDTRYTVYDQDSPIWLSSSISLSLSLSLCFHVVDGGTSLLVSSFTERDECRSKIPAVSSLTSTLMIKTQADGYLRSWNEEYYNLRRCRPSPIQNKREREKRRNDLDCLSLVSMTSHRTEGSSYTLDTRLDQRKPVSP